MKKIYFQFILLSFLISGCSWVCPTPINEGQKDVFTSDGCLVSSGAKKEEKKIPIKANIFIETSGSMFGFMPSNAGTEFQDDIYEIISTLGFSFKNQLDLFQITAKEAPLIKISKNDFQANLNSGLFQSSNSTDIPDMLDSILNRTNESSVSVFISDLIFSPESKNAQPMLDQIDSDIKRRLEGKGYSSTIFHLTSQYYRGSLSQAHSPYYVWIIGPELGVKKVRDAIKSSFNELDEVSFGNSYDKIPYSILPFAIPTMTNAFALECIPNHFYSLIGFDPEDKNTLEFYVAINLSDLPSYFSDPKYLRENLNINSDQAHVKITSIDPILPMKSKKDESVIKQIKATHLLKVEVSQFTTDNVKLELNIRRKNPSWITNMNSERDDPFRKRTCGLSKMIAGLEKAYTPQEFIFKQPLSILISKNSN